MPYDIPEPPRYAHVSVVTHADRGFSIHYPIARERSRDDAAARAEAALLARLDRWDAANGTGAAPAESPAESPTAYAPAATLAPDPAPTDQPHPAARVALIMGSSALLWAAIAAGVYALA